MLHRLFCDVFWGLGVRSYTIITQYGYQMKDKDFLHLVLVVLSLRRFPQASYRSLKSKKLTPIVLYQFIWFPTFFISEKNRFCEKNYLSISAISKVLGRFDNCFDFLWIDEAKMWPNLECAILKLSFDTQFAYLKKWSAKAKKHKCDGGHSALPSLPIWFRRPWRCF